MNNIKEEIERIELPLELSHRAALGVKQAKQETRNKKQPKWMLAAVAASILIACAGVSMNSSLVTDAAETLISQFFGSRENLSQTYPDANQEKFDLLELSLSIAEDTLTEKEFHTYSQQMKELVGIKSELKNENRGPNEKEEKRLHQLKSSMYTYENKFALTEARQLASFPVTKPSYTPKDYKQTDQSFAILQEGEEPIVKLSYRKGDSEITIQQLSTNQMADIESQAAGLFKQTTTYSLNGKKFDYASQKGDMDGMRLTVPNKDYKIVLTTTNLTKKEMEKVLLSMVENTDID
jgi:hypothetical protein